MTLSVSLNRRLLSTDTQGRWKSLIKNFRGVSQIVSDEIVNTFYSISASHQSIHLIIEPRPLENNGGKIQQKKCEVMKALSRFTFRSNQWWLRADHHRSVFVFSTPIVSKIHCWNTVATRRSLSSWCGRTVIYEVSYLWRWIMIRHAGCGSPLSFSGSSEVCNRCS